MGVGWGFYCGSAGWRWWRWRAVRRPVTPLGPAGSGCFPAGARRRFNDRSFKVSVHRSAAKSAVGFQAGEILRMRRFAGNPAGSSSSRRHRRGGRHHGTALPGCREGPYPPHHHHHCLPELGGGTPAPRSHRGRAAGVPAWVAAARAATDAGTPAARLRRAQGRERWILPQHRRRHRGRCRSQPPPAQTAAGPLVTGPPASPGPVSQQQPEPPG